MNETLALGLAGAAGLLLGATFFGGLWWTVNRGLSSPRPAVWFLGSLVARTGVVLVGFYAVAVSGGSWERLIFCLLGFLTARVVVSAMTRPQRGNLTELEREAGHATESR
jgi:F1F0 ATPase subunit 2